MITRADVEHLVGAWADEAARCRGGEWTGTLEEFEHGYVVWVNQPQADPLVRRVVDRNTGEITQWGTTPAPTVVENYCRRRLTYPAVQSTVDPRATIRRWATGYRAPTTAARLTLAHGGRTWIAYGAKGDQELNHHPLVQSWLDAHPPGHLTRGAERHAELIVISDLLHGNDAVTGCPTTLDDARTLFANPVTYTITRMRDQVTDGGKRALSCYSCRSALVHFGLYGPTMLTGFAEVRTELYAMRRPDFPAALRSLVTPGGFFDDPTPGRPTTVSHDHDHRLGDPPRPQAALEIIRRYRRCGYMGSAPGEAHRIEEFLLLPHGVGVFAGVATEFGRCRSVEAFTLGAENMGEGVLVGDERGRIFLLDQAGEWFLGDDIDAALITLFYGREQRRLRDDGTW